MTVFNPTSSLKVNHLHKLPFSHVVNQSIQRMNFKLPSQKIIRGRIPKSHSTSASSSISLSAAFADDDDENVDVHPETKAAQPITRLPGLYQAIVNLCNQCDAAALKALSFMRAEAQSQASTTSAITLWNTAIHTRQRYESALGEYFLALQQACQSCPSEIQGSVACSSPHAVCPSPTECPTLWFEYQAQSYLCLASSLASGPDTDPSRRPSEAYTSALLRGAECARQGLDWQPMSVDHLATRSDPHRVCAAASTGESPLQCQLSPLPLCPPPPPVPARRARLQPNEDGVERTVVFLGYPYLYSSLAECELRLGKLVDAVETAKRAVDAVAGWEAHCQRKNVSSGVDASNGDDVNVTEGDRAGEAPLVCPRTSTIVSPFPRKYRKKYHSIRIIVEQVFHAYRESMNCHHIALQNSLEHFAASCPDPERCCDAR